MDLHSLTDGWQELESDPGLFTLLLEDMGVRGVQVEEIYDLHKPFHEDMDTGERQRVYGFIFLFRWSKESRRESRATSRAVNRNNPNFGVTESADGDAEKINRMFFAHQIVPNSCATHALISVLLNCPSIELGETLAELKKDTHLMSPENKGYAISNCLKLATAHNRHASSHVESDTHADSSASSGLSRFGRLDPSAAEGAKALAQFHFVSYLPIDGHLYELDGLKSAPFDHGPWSPDEEWTDLFRRVIQTRIKNDADIRYALMSVVPDKRLALIKRLQALKVNRNVIFEALKKIVTDFRLPSPFEYHNYFASSTATSTSIASNTKDTIATTICKSNSSSATTTPTAASPPLITSSLQPEFPKNGGGDGCTNDLKVEEPTRRDEEQEMQTEPITSSASQSPIPQKPLSRRSSSCSPSSSGTETCSESQWKVRDATMVDTVADGHEQHVAKESPDDILTEEQVPVSKLFVFRLPRAGATEPALTGEVAHAASADADPSDKEFLEKQKQARGSARDLLDLLASLERKIEHAESALNNELEKRAKYRLDDERRTHSYDKFFHDFILLLKQAGIPLENA